MSLQVVAARREQENQVLIRAAQIEVLRSAKVGRLTGNFARQLLLLLRMATSCIAGLVGRCDFFSLCHRTVVAGSRPPATEVSSNMCLQDRRPAPEPKRGKCHWDFLLEEMKWMAAEFTPVRTPAIGCVLQIHVVEDLGAEGS